MNKISEFKHLPEPDELSTIEKLIWCLDDAHFETFVQILESQNAKLSAKLISTIRKQAEKEKWGNLCKLVYGEDTSKFRQSLNQLSSYTFKLSYYLVQNYPAYLQTNIHTLQRLVNDGNIKVVDFLCEILIDVAEKTEDYATLKYIYQVKQQQAFLSKDITRGNRYQALLKGVMEDELTLNNVYYIQRFHFNINSDKVASDEEIAANTAYLKPLTKHPRANIRLLSMFVLLYVKYYFQPKSFSSEKTVKEIELFEKEINLQSYVAFPPLMDMLSIMNFLKLNSPLVDLDSAEGQKEFKQMQQHYSKVSFWKSYLNIPELNMLTVKASYYLSKYSSIIHESKPDLLPKEIEEVTQLKKRCEEVLAMPVMNEKGHNSDRLYISLTYACLLLLGTQKEIKRAVEMIEGLLFSYQQLNINASLDSIFLCLILGNFALKDYDMCAKTFVRYSKLSKGKPLYEDNDLSIHILYYTAQLLATGRKQYTAKLQKCFDTAFQNDFFRDSRKLLQSLAQSYKLKFESDFFVSP